VRLHWRLGTRTDVGLAREGNEDSFYAGPSLLAVADGVGGSVAGEIASTIAIATLAPLDGGSGGDDPRAALQDAIRTVNDRMRDAIAREPALNGMGTTLTAMLWSDDALGLAQIGDSRAYLLRDERLVQITRDQTLVQSLIDEGQITAEQAQTHPRRSWILQALDGRAETEPAVEILTPEVHDRYLLCSDGLSDYVPEQEIVAALQLDDPQPACDRLIDLALHAGAPDNVTCIVADIADKAAEQAPVVGGAAASQTSASRLADAAPVAAGEPAADARADADDAAPKRRSIGRRLAAVACLIVILIAAAVIGVAVYVHHQWYVAPSQGKVAIYQGVQGSAAGVDLSHVHSLTDIPVTALPQVDRQRVVHGIQPTGGQSGAAAVVSNLRQAACVSATPSPTATPKPTRSAHSGKHHRASAPSRTPAPSPPTWCVATP
jgi:protein phosphatase